MAWLFVYCILGVLTTMLLAALTVAVFIGLRRLLGGGDRFRVPPE